MSTEHGARNTEQPKPSDGTAKRGGLPQRTKGLAIRIIRLYASLPRSEPAVILGRQLLRSATSVGAHCREAFRPRSDAELVSKLEVALQELDEATYWVELLVEAGIVAERRVQTLMQEMNEITSITVASIRTVKQRRR